MSPTMASQKHRQETKRHSPRQQHSKKKTAAASPSSQQFGKQLAHSDKEVRDEALQTLQRYLSNAKDLPELDWLKLWKAIFYCFWMSDKPKIQHQLANDLAATATSLKKKSCRWDYVKYFFVTMSREWNGIDRLRLDKYYTILRKFLSRSFSIMASGNWNDEDVDSFLDIMKAWPLNDDPDVTPDGIRYFVTEIYIEELEKIVAAEAFESVPTVMLLNPFILLMSRTPNPMVFKRVKETIFDVLSKRVEESGDDRYDIGMLSVEMEAVANEHQTPVGNATKMIKICQAFNIVCPPGVPLDLDDASAEEMPEEGVGSNEEEEEEEKEEESSDETIFGKDEDDEYLDESVTEESTENIDDGAEVETDESMETAPAIDEQDEIALALAATASTKDGDEEIDLDALEGETVVANDNELSKRNKRKRKHANKNAPDTSEAPKKKTSVTVVIEGKKSPKVSSSPVVSASEAAALVVGPQVEPVSIETTVETVTFTTPVAEVVAADANPPTSDSKRVIWSLKKNTVKQFYKKSLITRDLAASPVNSASDTPPPKSALRSRRDSLVAKNSPVVGSSADAPITSNMSPVELRNLTRLNTLNNQPPKPPKKKKQKGKKRATMRR